MGTRLAKRAYDAIRLVEDSNFKQRSKKLESIEERGFALILRWNQIETALKLIRYGYSIKDGWPDQLNFLGTNWKSLQNLKKDNLDNYELVLGSSAKSLWKVRNEIAHEGCNVQVDDYNKYVEAAIWTIEKLKRETPNSERLRDIKRRSDAHLKKNKRMSDV